MHSLNPLSHSQGLVGSTPPGVGDPSPHTHPFEGLYSVALF